MVNLFLYFIAAKIFSILGAGYEVVPFKFDICPLEGNANC